MIDICNPDPVTVELHPTTASHLDDAMIAIYGLVAIQEKLVTTDERPEWWTEFHDGALIAGLKTALRTADGAIDPMLGAVRDQQGEDGHE